MSKLKMIHTIIGCIYFHLILASFSFAQQCVKNWECTIPDNNGQWQCTSLVTNKTFSCQYDDVIIPEPEPDLTFYEFDVGFFTDDNGVRWNDQTGPAGEYNISNMAPGDYKFSVYANGPNGDGDSIFFGIDGVLVGTLSFNIWESPGPKWSSKLQNGSEAVLNIPDSGAHIINLWAREDGAQIIKIKLEKIL